ncbi:MAG: coenzyme F420-0:L-glutamate ligase / coenzyme F420:gamma-L-glutamate ligase [Acidobacteriaceae bacterium]|jgi:coenzyme F420-0:L-glutamate ligase/coenzyme F420-1:gamma-L-glutamate ligase
MIDTFGDIQSMSVIPIRLEEDVCPGDDIAEKLIHALTDRQAKLMSGDILIVKHKIVSKAEDQFVELDSVQPSEASRTWAQRYGLDARTTELALMQSERIVRQERGVLITRTKHGFVCANSGVDVSNVDGGRRALLLPDDPDNSARGIHSEIERRLQLYIPVIITDTFGRPWREGLTEAAIGVAGMKAIHDYRGQSDPHGYPLRVSLEAVADELACAAGLVCGKLSRVPACIIRGFPYQPAAGTAGDLIRSAANDLFQ